VNLKRLLLVAGALLVAAIAIYWFTLRYRTVEAAVEVPRLAAVIGSGDEAVLVGAEGQILHWSRRPKHLHLPSLPLDAPPKSGRLKGPVLEQAEVLGAVPVALRRFVVGSHYGVAGVEVELTSGIELRFGDSSQAERKWTAAAAVLADRSISALDYVNLQSPSHPSTGGEGHLLPE
jgi:hypothetical protein